MFKPTFNAYRVFLQISNLMKSGQITLQEINEEITITFINRSGVYYSGKGTHICDAFKKLQEDMERAAKDD